MGKNNSIAKSNRQDNSGGVMPERINTITAFVKLFYQAKKLGDNVNSGKLLVVFLYLWLTQQLDSILKQDDKHQINAEDIPNCIRVTSRCECGAHRFKNQKSNDNKSWTYYARATINPSGVNTFEWQPIPNSLIHIFRSFTGKQSYNTHWLTANEKQQLLNLLQVKWRKPAEIEHFTAAKKELFLTYISHCILVDNQMSGVTKSLLLPVDKLHHRSASAYQQNSSEKVRAEIFHAQDRYLSRLFTYANAFGLSKLLTFRFSSRSKARKSKLTAISLVNENAKINIPFDITSSKVGVSFHNKLVGEELKKYADKSALYGSSRLIAESRVVEIFRQLHDEIISAKQSHKHSRTTLINYHNLCANHLALLCILLTGLRPTHAISIKKQLHYDYRRAALSDKGVHREITICNYLRQQILHYKKLQQKFTEKQGFNNQIIWIWNLYDENGQAIPISAKSLRLFLHQRAPGVVPYVLRHQFAQSAMSSVIPKLPTHQIDRLMAHANYGEHLGSDLVFSTSREQQNLFLNTLPTRYGLEELKYV